MARANSDENKRTLHMTIKNNNYSHMKQPIIIFGAVSTLLILLSCNAPSSDQFKNNEVIIGKQVWMTQNLNVDTFRNGDPIPEAKSDKELQDYSQAGEAAWCYYGYDPKNGEKYGKLYNWYAVNDSQGLAPKGWHVPTDEEWTMLIDYLGGEEKAGTKMKSKSGWYQGGNGINASGFSGLPGGHGSPGGFEAIGKVGNWWSSTEYDTGAAWLRSLNYLDGNVNWSSRSQAVCFSVRCLRD